MISCLLADTPGWPPGRLQQLQPNTWFEPTKTNKHREKKGQRSLQTSAEYEKKPLPTLAQSTLFPLICCLVSQSVRQLTAAVDKRQVEGPAPFLKTGSSDVLSKQIIIHSTAKRVIVIMSSQ